MISILRQIPQGNWELILLLFIVLVSVFLYNRDAKRFASFYRSFYTKQFEITYGRYLKVSHYFMVLLSLQSILFLSFIISAHLKYCSKFTDYSKLFLLSFMGILAYLIAKWTVLYGVSIVFKKERLYHLLSVKSTQLVNLYLAPIFVCCLFLYLKYGFTPQILSSLVSLLLFILIFIKISTYTYIRKATSMSVFYIILYLCIFEMVPLLWVLIGLDC